METLLTKAETLVKEQFGRDASLKHGTRDGAEQWWVSEPGHQKYVLAASTLRDMVDRLTQQSPKPQPNGGGLLDTKQVAAIVKVLPSSVGNLYRKRGLRVAGWVPGRGGKKPRFRLEDVMEWTKDHAVRQHRPHKYPKRPGAGIGKKIKATTVPRTQGGTGTQLNATLTVKTRARMAAFINRFQMPPFHMTVNSFIESAVVRELDRLEREAR